MSRIDRLIRKLCPNGVLYYKLGRLEDDGLIKLGRGNVISKKDIVETPGNYPVYSSSAVGNGEFGRYGKYMFDDERISWSVDGGGRFFYRPAQKYSVTNVSGWLKVKNEDRILTKYLYYVLDSAWSTKIFDYTKKAHPSVIREEYDIPVPPLEVQRAIVDVLDKFTALEKAIGTELQARRKQFEYYRDELFSFEDDEKVKWLPLGEVGEFIRGKRFTKADYVDDGIGVIHYGEIYTHYGTSADSVLSHVRKELEPKLRFAKPGDVVITDVGETVDDVGKAVAWIGNEEVAIHDHCYAFRHMMNPKFVAYYMQTTRFRSDKARYIARTKVNTLLIDGLAKVSMPVPPMDEQNQIVSVLDNFDSLVHNTSYGLPAEISARRKQYEYYRDRLLTFQEATA